MLAGMTPADTPTWTVPAPQSLAGLVHLRLADGTVTSRQALAEAAGVSQASLSRYCSGLAAPRPETAQRLADALRVDLDLLSGLLAQ